MIKAQEMRLLTEGIGLAYENFLDCELVEAIDLTQEWIKLTALNGTRSYEFYFSYYKNPNSKENKVHRFLIKNKKHYERFKMAFETAGYTVNKTTSISISW